jgi:hypothetical protein
MNTNKIEFDFTEMEAFAKLIRHLNEQGIPYHLVKDRHAISVQIETGY